MLPLKGVNLEINFNLFIIRIEMVFRFCFCQKKIDNGAPPNDFDALLGSG